MAWQRLGLAGWGGMNYPSGLAVTEQVSPDGQPDDPIVVLVHGVLDRSSGFSRVVRRLPDLHTVTYDRRGDNRSRNATPLNTTLGGHSEDLLQIIGGRPAVVVGHSYGGTVALGAAVSEGGAGSIGSVAAFEPPLPWIQLDGYRLPPSLGPIPIDQGPDFAAEQFFRRMVGDQGWDRLSESARRERRADGPALVAELASLQNPDPPFDITALSIPALFGRGEHSTPRHRASVAWLAEHLPGAELMEIAGGSHGSHLTHPEAFAAFVRRAVERRPVAGATGTTTASVSHSATSGAGIGAGR